MVEAAAPDEATAQEAVVVAPARHLGCSSHSPFPHFFPNHTLHKIPFLKMLEDDERSMYERCMKIIRIMFTVWQRNGLEQELFELRHAVGVSIPEAGKDAKKKHYGGAGGDGIPSDITGETKWYAGGGGGGVNKNGNKELENGGGLGGRGGGGKGSSWASEVKHGAASFTGTDGEDNTGGGGGGTDPECRVGGVGGSGLVVVRYPSPVPLMVGGSITSKGGYQIHSFQNVGTSKLEYDPGQAS